jgi:sugar-specific transcriptional regulator TrmB
MKAVLNGKMVVGMLRDFGLSEYEARVYFVLLTLGESKVTPLTKKAYVPQSKGYEVLDRLIDKGFVEQTSEERPKKFRAKTLDRIMTRIMSREQRFIRKLNSNFESLQTVIDAISPMYEKYGAFRLFSPVMQRREEMMKISLQV